MEDFYQMYVEEMESIIPCSAKERETLARQASEGSREAKNRLIEGHLFYSLELAKEYAGKAPDSDLVQEANMALTMMVLGYEGGDFMASLEEAVRKALDAFTEEEARELEIEENIAARVNVLKEVSQMMAEQLGREATVTELAERMKMTEEEIKDIMKITLDALNVDMAKGAEL